VHVGLLGVVEARRGDDPLPLPGLRLRGLLARLALAPDRTVPVALLVDDLWGDAPPDGAANALQALVSRLRRVVGAGVVVTDDGGYRLRVDGDAVDATRFDGLVAAAGGADPGTARELLGQALQLWRGPALADLTGLPFSTAAANRLDERRARAVEHRARLALQVADPEPELEALAAQLDALPLREHTAVLLARCLHAAGRQADALAVLDRTTAALADQLGVDPGPELAAARLAVLRAAPSPRDVPAPPAPAPLRPGPAALTSFVGRDADLARVTTLLTGARLVTLTGPGGAGKTRLAREAVAALGGSAGRSATAELAALSTADQLPAALLTAVGATSLLRVPDEPGPDTTTRLLAALADHDVVLVLDNCEHLVDAVARLTATVLESCPRLRVLATSREPLGVPGEVLHPVHPLAPADAVRLFVERAAAVRPGFRLTADAVPAVEEICRRLDGQPLPIELAAARLRTLSPAEIAARLDDRFRLLTSGARTALPRHQTLRAVVDWSWELLAEPERAVARRLAVFAGGATAAGAEAVCAGAGGPAADEVFDLLAALVDKSVVVAVPGPGDGPTRYRMLETIREYAAERLDAAGERPAAEAAHRQLVLELVEEAEPHLRAAQQLVWLAQLAAEAEEIDLALRRAVAERDAATAHRLVAGMGWSWVVRGLVDESTRWARAVHQLEGPVPAEARALTAAYHLLVEVGNENLSAAALVLDRAVQLAAQVGPPRHPVLELVEPVRRLFVEGDERPTRGLADRATDPWLRAVALCLLGTRAGNDGRIDEQRALLRAAHALFAGLGERSGLGLVVRVLGELEDVAGRYDAAARAYDEGIELATELANDDDLPQLVARRAMLDARQGDLGAATTGMRRAMELAGGRAQLDPLLGGYRAELARLSGQLDLARAELDRLEVGLRTAGVGVAQRRAAVALARAKVELDAEDPDAARPHLVEAVRWAIEGEDGPASAAVGEVAARLAVADDDVERAAVLLGVAVAQRGAPDLGDREVVALDAAVRAALGAEPADRAFRAGRELPRGAGMELLRRAVGGAPVPVATS
jgi:predicted ATPase/DNA-binding SARP family transcriptional activator